jgi:hypothetical protein
MKAAIGMTDPPFSMVNRGKFIPNEMNERNINALRANMFLTGGQPSSFTGDGRREAGQWERLSQFS